VRGLVLLLVLAGAMPLHAQSPCVARPERGEAVPAPPSPGQPPLDLSRLCLQLDAIAARLAAIEAQQKAEAAKKPALVVVLGNRYVELALVAAGAFVAGLKLR
jgi:hypothetical protein